ncbi:MAG: MFS transporter [Aestuariibacter sp.]
MLEQLQAYKDKRILTIFIFGMASGFPWVMIGSAMSAWLKDESLSRSAIGLFGLIFVAYSINFLWSPLLDRIKLPMLGIRRGWILLMQMLIVACCLAMATLNVQEQLWYMAAIGFAIALSSATQDIAIDAYRIDTIGEHERDKLSAASAVATAGWWTGYGGMGAIPFFIADWAGWTWNDVYIVLAGLMACFSVAVLLAKEPSVHRDKAHNEAEKLYGKLIGGNNQAPSVARKIVIWLMVTVVEPFREFFSRNGVKFALSVLLFIVLFKMGEAFLGRMSIVFYKEIGFSNTEIGTYSKLLNWWVTIFFAIVGGLVNIRYGIHRGLMISGITMALSNLMFAVIAIVGPNKALFVSAIFIDGFTTAWSSVAMVAFISLLCNRAFSATQYALMASLGVVGRTSLSSASGFIVDGMGGNWSLFFVLTAVMVIPSLVFLWSIKSQVNALEQRMHATA